MKAAGRIVVTLVVAYVASQAAGWLTLVVATLVTHSSGSSTVVDVVAGGGAIAGAVAAATCVWRWTASDDAPRAQATTGLMSIMVKGALLTGLIGFAGGFFGPMIVAPGANQGPLLGIFITGPLGLVAGAIGGAVYWMRRRNVIGES